MKVDAQWWEGTSKLFALDKGQKCKFMILLRGPYERSEIATLLGVKSATVIHWETGVQTPRLAHLRKLMTHFTNWYLTQGLPTTLTAALAEITEKKGLTSGKKPDKKAVQYEVAEE